MQEKAINAKLKARHINIKSKDFFCDEENFLFKILIRQEVTVPRQKNITEVQSVIIKSTYE